MTSNPGTTEADRWVTRLENNDYFQAAAFVREQADEIENLRAAVRSFKAACDPAMLVEGDHPHADFAPAYRAAMEVLPHE